MAAAWSLLVLVLRRVLVSPHAPSPPVPWRPGAGLLGQCAALAVAIAILIVLVLRLGGLGVLDVVRGAFQRTATPLANDLLTVLQAVSAAGAVCIVFTAVSKPSWLRRCLSWPRVGRTVSWCPLLVWLPALTSAAGPRCPLWLWPAIFATLEGSALLGRRRLELESSPVLAASRALGSTGLRAWRLHVLPGLLATFVSWVPRAAANTLLWLVFVSFLRAAPAGGAASLGASIAAAAPGVLDALPPLVEPALIAGISALCLWELSRMIRSFTSHQ